MSPPVAIVTGASSGIGLALTKHLLSLHWHVAMADINPPPEQLPDTTFIRTNIASWSDQAALFAQTHAQHGRLDFCALNAGIDDRDDIFASVSSDVSNPPKQPNMLPLDVNLTGTYYGVKLAAHYMTLDSSAAGKKQQGGKIVVTASAAGIRALPVVPQYSMTKHGLIGMVRSMGPVAQVVNIRINAVCPALVATGLAPAGLMDSFSQEQITPMSTIIRCFDELAQFERVGEQGWVEEGRNGETVEGNLKKLIWHQPPANESEYTDDKGLEAWTRAYMERNKNFALQDWMDGKK